jgi:hypothetical protein
MTTTPPRPPLAVAETDEIAALLADLMPAGESSPAAAPKHAPLADAVEEVAPPARPSSVPPVGNRPLGQVLGQANWRNEPPPPAVGQPYEGPFPAPIGVLALDEFWELVNWRNQPDEAHELPLLGVLEPPAGHEWTVASVLSQFGWD